MRTISRISRLPATCEAIPARFVVSSNPPAFFFEPRGDSLRYFHSSKHAYQAVPETLQSLYLVTHHVDCILVPPEMNEVNQRVVAERKTRLESLRREITEGGIVCRAEARFGSPWREIVNYAKRAKCDLIVFGASA